MPNSPDWRTHPAQALETFSAAWSTGGTGRPDWSLAEEWDTVSCNDRQVARESALRIGLEHLEPLVQTYGSALKCQFLLGRLVVLDLGQGVDQSAVDAFHAMIADSSTVELDLVLDKSRLAKDWYPAACRPDAPPPILYFDPRKALEFIAQANLAQLEKNLWRGCSDQRVILLVPASDISYSGPFLAVLGGRYLLPGSPLTWGALDPARAASAAANLQRCRDALKWQAPYVENLTPWHLAGQVEPDCSLHPLVSALHTHLANAFLLFTADSSSLRHRGLAGEGLVSTYASTQQSVELPHASPETYAGPPVPPANFDALADLLDWAYDPAWNAEDRLALVQIGVVDALRGAPAERAFGLLLENAPALLENVRFHWKGFVEGKINAYTAQVQALENAVGAAVKGYAGQIAVLVKGLSDAVLAAVGVLIGTFIGALFDKNFSALIFQIGMLAYSAYIFFFPLVYNMLFQWRSYALLKQDFDSRKARFAARLPGDTVAEILKDGRVEEAQREFWLWYAFTVLAYLALAALGLWAAFNIPAILAAGPVP